MSLEALKTIHEAEEAARKEKAAAAAEAGKAVAEAEREGKLALENAKRQGEEEAAEIVKKAEQMA